jgi:hypothetical protein
MLSKLSPKAMLFGGIFGIFGLGCVGGLLLSHESDPVMSWIAVDRDLAQISFQQNFKIPLTPKSEAQMRVMYFSLLGSPQIAAIDFGNRELCGSAGCPYALYISGSPPKLIQRFLLYPTPAGTPLFSVKDNLLTISQVSPDGQLLGLRYQYDPNSEQLIYRDRFALGGN